MTVSPVKLDRHTLFLSVSASCGRGHRGGDSVISLCARARDAYLLTRSWWRESTACRARRIISCTCRLGTLGTFIPSRRRAWGGARLAAPRVRRSSTLARSGAAVQQRLRAVGSDGEKTVERPQKREGLFPRAALPLTPIRGGGGFPLELRGRSRPPAKGGGYPSALR